MIIKRDSSIKEIEVFCHECGEFFKNSMPATFYNVFLKFKCPECGAEISGRIPREVHKNERR